MRKIAMLGTAHSAVDAPFDDKSWEIWGVSAKGDHVTRADRWFELHRLSGEPKEWRDLWRKMLKGFTQDLDLYMLYPESDLGPSVIPYPYEKITRRFGTYFMTSTFGWMLALAIDELRPVGEKPVDGEIGVWGVDMEYTTEYAQQRNGFRHFIDLARAMGISVTRPANSGVSYEPVPYPMWQDDPLVNKLMLRQVECGAKLDEQREMIRHTRTRIAQNIAIREGLSRFGNKDAPAEITRLSKEYDALISMSAVISKDIVYWEATCEEQGWLKDYLTV